MCVAKKLVVVTETLLLTLLTACLHFVVVLLSGGTVFLSIQTGCAEVIEIESLTKLSVSAGWSPSASA